MYQTHFGMHEPAFGITPDTGFAFGCRSHQEAINTLLVAVQNGEGFMKVTGEVGTGKTLLCRTFLAMLGERWVTAYIPNPQLDPRSLLLALAEELQVEVPRDVDQHQLLKRLALALLDFARSGRSVVVCLDEAQAMPIETLESLRLLTNLETEKRKLLQVVLFGQPELDARLAHASVRQLRQRITFQTTLSALTLAEVELYVAHRLRIAGHCDGRLFDAGAVRALHRASGGVPRLVNILAHKAMLLAFGEGVHTIAARHVCGARADTPAAHPPRARWWWLGFVMMLASAGTAGWTLLG